VLDELHWKLVEVLSQLDLATQHPEGIRDGSTARQRYQSRHRPARALDDDLLTALSKIYKPRQLALGFMHSDAHHEP